MSTKTNEEMWCIVRYDKGQISYYAGYSTVDENNKTYPVFTKYFDEAVKVETQRIAEDWLKIMENQYSLNDCKVEAHMYM